MDDMETAIAAASLARTKQYAPFNQEIYVRHMRGSVPDSGPGVRPLSAQHIADAAAMLLRDGLALSGGACGNDDLFYFGSAMTGRADQFQVSFYLPPSALTESIQHFSDKYLSAAMTKLARSVPAGSVFENDGLNTPFGVDMAALDSGGVLRVVVADRMYDNDPLPVGAAKIAPFYDIVTDTLISHAHVASVMRFDVRIQSAKAAVAA